MAAVWQLMNSGAPAEGGRRDAEVVVSTSPVPDSDEEPIGLEVWPAARVLLEWLSNSSDARPLALQGSTLLELGAGTGFLAMSLTAPGSAAGVTKVYATEGEERVLQNMRSKVEAGGCADRVHPLRWDWEETRHAPAEIPLEEVDLVVGSDLVYVGTAQEELAGALAALLGDKRCRPGLRAILLLTCRPAGGERFVSGNKHPGIRAVDYFLTQCAAQALDVLEIPLPADLMEASLGAPREEAGALRGGANPDERLRLFDIRKVELREEALREVA